MSGGKLEIDRRIGADSAVMQLVYRYGRELSHKTTMAMNFGVMTERKRWPKWVFFHREARLTLRNTMKSSDTWEKLRVKPLFLRIEKSQLWWHRYLFRMSLGYLPRELFQACTTGRRTQGRPRTCWGDNVPQLTWERLGILPTGMGEVYRVWELWASLLRLLPLLPISRYSRRRWDDTR